MTKSSASGSGSFWRILQHCETEHFSTIWLTSPWKTDRIFIKIVSYMYL